MDLLGVCGMPVGLRGGFRFQVQESGQLSVELSHLHRTERLLRADVAAATAGLQLGDARDTGRVNRSYVVPVVLGLVVAVGVVGLIGDRRGDDVAPAAEVPSAAPDVAPGEMRGVARSTGIPRRALAAYVDAAQRVGRDDPQCHIAWNTLAGIGSSESSHGSFGGARLRADGVASPLIIGVALDGTGGNRAVDDTDGGVLDADTTWDRAVGPMQFIPTTWAVWGVDADGDGKSDPHDIADAALAAARYLCDAGKDLSGSQGWSRAVLAYNNSGDYARKIARTAATYADLA
jgi:hypothetical protein